MERAPVCKRSNVGEGRQISRLVASRIRHRQRRRMLWFSVIAAIVVDLLSEAWWPAATGTCEICGGDIDWDQCGSDIARALAGEATPAGPGLICGVGHTTHVACLELDVVKGTRDTERLVGRCSVCESTRG